MKRTACTAVAVFLLGVPTVALSQTAARSPSTEAEVRQLPDEELKKRYLACSHASEQRAMARVQVHECSIAYDALLTRTFRGNYEALRAWSSPDGAVIARAEARRPD